MQLVNCKRMNQMAQRRYKAVHNIRFDNRVDDFLKIIVLVHVIRNIQKLIDNIYKPPRYLLAHPRARVLCRNHLADKNQPVDGKALPLVGDRALLPKPL